MDEYNIPSIGNTSQGVVPSQESSEQSKHTTRLDAANLGSLWLSNTSILQLQVTDGQEQESEIQGEEEEEEGDGRAERADQEDGGEDEPASEVESNGMVEVVLVGVSVANGESTGGQNDGE